MMEENNVKSSSRSKEYADEFPSMRNDIQIIPAQFKGMRVFVVQDYLGLIPPNLLLSFEMVRLLISLKKGSTIKDLKLDSIGIDGWKDLSQTQLVSTIHQLDDLMLLDSERFREAKKRLSKVFSGSVCRPLSQAGISYPSDPVQLSGLIKNAIQSGKTRIKNCPKPPKVIVVPHIDLSTGFEIYGNAYSCWPAKVPERILLMGTGHYLTGGYIAVTRKNLETPFGVLRNDHNVSDKIGSAMGGALASNDFAFKSEHSIEFQSLFIRYLLKENDSRIIPVISGSFSGFLDSVSRPGEYLQIAAVIEVLREIVADPGTLVIASVDLSHVGHKFGHSETAKSMEALMKSHDAVLLDALIKGDVISLWAEVQKCSDEFNVCGFSTLSLILEMIEDLEGTILDYTVFFEEVSHSAVSCAAAVLWQK